MRLKYYLAFILFLLYSTTLFSENPQKKRNDNLPDSISVKSDIEFLKKYFFTNKIWHVISRHAGENIEGLVHFVEDQPIDSILKDIDKYDKKLVTRLPEDVADTLSIKGYISSNELNRRLAEIEKSIRDEFANKTIDVPDRFLEGIEEKAGTIAPGKGLKLYEDSVYILPDSLKLLDAVPESMMKTAEDFQRILKLDSVRNVIVERHRRMYNDSIVTAYRDSVTTAYRQNLIQNIINTQKKRLIDSVKISNYELVKEYNDEVVSLVNDSIKFALANVAEYAAFTDTTVLNFLNLRNQSSSILLSNNPRLTRVWVKNEQNDSISIMLRSMDKRTIQMLLDDGVTITRFVEKESKKINFDHIRPSYNLEKIMEKYKVETPWKLEGNGNLGFTQTYLQNWKKGGQSAISLLTVLKGSAIYEQNKVKWENNAEIRNGWIQTGGEGEKIQKNDDKFEITSRFGLSAFKKWYYSAELDFETQFFRGYNYPDRTTPISGFLSPARTLLKIGMDYKPNKNLSVFISPLTAKLISVRDTAIIDQTKFGVDENKKRFWEPGLNADIKLKKKISPDITYETKYKMFINYTAPFKKFDINWENQVTMQLTERINMQMMLHLLYDDNVLFTETKTINGVETTISKPKLQVKELITVGFSYNINKKIYKARNLM